jgi:hypothetical protein
MPRVLTIITPGHKIISNADLSILEHAATPDYHHDASFDHFNLTSSPVTSKPCVENISFRWKSIYLTVGVAAISLLVAVSKRHNYILTVAGLLLRAHSLRERLISASDA